MVLDSPVGLQVAQPLQLHKRPFHKALYDDAEAGAILHELAELMEQMEGAF